MREPARHAPPELTVGQLFAHKRETLQLDLLGGEAGLNRVVTVPEASSPGLVLAGFTERFLENRLHVLGETEVEYLKSLGADACRQAIGYVMRGKTPCVFVTKGQTVPAPVQALAQEQEIPLIRSQLKTSEFYRRLTPYLTEVFAPSTSVHGSLADVYGVGLLFVGRSGIGKSECVLDLVERGHRLVADDTVQVSRRGADVLIGKADDMAYRYMEIRGAGLVDVSGLFGVRAVRRQKRIEVVVELTDWDSTKPVERTGLDTHTVTILDVQVPLVTVPLNPGKNITVVSEVVALSHLLRYTGVNPAREFNEKLIARMAKQRQVREYLSEDYE